MVQSGCEETTKPILNMSTKSVQLNTTIVTNKSQWCTPYSLRNVSAIAKAGRLLDIKTQTFRSAGFSVQKIPRSLPNSHNRSVLNL